MQEPTGRILAPELAQQFVDFTQSIEGIQLDYSVSSLERVDEIIEKMRREGLKVGDADRVLFIAGCYVGEVIVRHQPGKWVSAEESSVYANAGPTIILKFGSEQYTSPIGKVIKRLQNGEEDYLPFYYQMLAKLIKDGPPHR